MRATFFLTPVVALILFLAPTSASSQGPQEFGQLVQQLAANPGDVALRKQIIVAARNVKPAPVISEEARRAFVMGTTIAKTATTPSQQTLAVSNFQEAVKLAPWWGDAYYNLAIAQELAAQFDAARASLDLYILTNPGEQATREARDKVYAIEATQALRRQQATDAANTVEAKAARERQFLASLEGVIWMGSRIVDLPGLCANDACTRTKTSYMRDGYSVRGGQIVLVRQTWDQGMSQPAPTHVQIMSDGIFKPVPLLSLRVQFRGQTPWEECNNAAIQISDDGYKMTVTFPCSRMGQPVTFARVN